MRRPNLRQETGGKWVAGDNEPRCHAVLHSRCRSEPVESRGDGRLTRKVIGPCSRTASSDFSIAALSRAVSYPEDEGLVRILGHVRGFHSGFLKAALTTFQGPYIEPVPAAALGILKRP